MVKLDADTNRVVVGTRDAASSREFTLRECMWSGERPMHAQLKVRLRSNAVELDCMVDPHDETSASVTLTQPTLFVSPGQSAVFYDGDRVAGGGIIDRRN